eukprot:scaffold99190_cov42-Attheya_sp.AAC.6
MFPTVSPESMNPTGKPLRQSGSMIPTVKPLRHHSEAVIRTWSFALSLGSKHGNDANPGTEEESHTTHSKPIPESMIPTVSPESMIPTVRPLRQSGSMIPTLKPLQHHFEAMIPTVNPFHSEGLIIPTVTPGSETAFFPAGDVSSRQLLSGAVH